jgi:hypothetical protein
MTYYYSNKSFYSFKKVIIQSVAILDAWNHILVNIIMKYINSILIYASIQLIVNYYLMDGWYICLKLILKIEVHRFEISVCLPYMSISFFKLIIQWTQNFYNKYNEQFQYELIYNNIIIFFLMQLMFYIYLCILLFLANTLINKMWFKYRFLFLL